MKYPVFAGMTALVSFSAFLLAADEQERRERVTIMLGGSHCKQCVAVMEKALRQVEGFEIPKEPFAPGKPQNYFSKPVVVEITDPENAYLGQLAAALAKVETPHAKEAPSTVNVVLHTSDRIDEELVQKLRDRLRTVNGLVVDRPGALGGQPNRNILWVRLEDAGGAELRDIRAAVREFKEPLKLVEEHDS